ncbi:MAG TPA: hypothetical protein VFC41_02920 [Anaerovoracaceae bacterium]|nr:hypothetical protein [Anaerovoracaceae bacterium]
MYKSNKILSQSVSDTTPTQSEIRANPRLKKTLTNEIALPVEGQLGLGWVKQYI